MPGQTSGWWAPHVRVGPRTLRSLRSHVLTQTARVEPIRHSFRAAVYGAPGRPLILSIYIRPALDGDKTFVTQIIPMINDTCRQIGWQFRPFTLPPTKLRKNPYNCNWGEDFLMTELPLRQGSTNILVIMISFQWQYRPSEKVKLSATIHRDPVMEIF